MKHILFFFAGLLLILGCAGIYSSVSFEILEPANVNFPDYVKNIMILNRAPVAFEMFEEEDVRSLTAGQLRIIDTMIINNVWKGLNLKLRNSDVSVYKAPVWINRRRNDTLGLNIPLTKKEVNDICIENECDAIISLEYYRLNIDDKFEYSEEELISNYYEATNLTRWAIYLRGAPRPIREYSSHDTLYFTRVAEGNFYELPSSAEMVRNIAFESGLSYGNYLVPSWSMIERLLYKGKEEELKETTRYTNGGDWDKAYNIWQGLLENKDSTLAAKAAYNMAVYHELEDDLLTALQFVLLSERLDSTEIAESYREDLQIRILNRKEIMEQME